MTSIAVTLGCGHEYFLLSPEESGLVAGDAMPVMCAFCRRGTLLAVVPDDNDPHDLCTFVAVACALGWEGSPIIYEPPFHDMWGGWNERQAV